MSHTPGPWGAFAARNRIVESDFEVIGSENAIVALVYPGLNPRYSAVDNANLIAAAPDLLAALEAVRANIGMYQEVGRSYAELEPKWGRSTGDYYESSIQRDKQLIDAAICKARGREIEG